MAASRATYELLGGGLSPAWIDHAPILMSGHCTPGDPPQIKVDQGHAGDRHSHGLVDNSIKRSRDGLREASISRGRCGPDSTLAASPGCRLRLAPGFASGGRRFDPG